MTSKRKRRKPAEDGPLLFLRGRWWAADLRPWGGSRPTLVSLSGARRGQRTENKDTALRWAWEHIERLRQEVHAAERGKPSRKTLEQAAAEYLKACDVIKEYNTVKGIRTALNHMLAAFPGRQLASIEDAEIAAWFAEQAGVFKPSTLTTLRAHVRTFLVEAGRPMQKQIKLARMQRADVDALTDSEIDALLAAAEDPVEQAIVRLGIATGCRRAELWALEYADFAGNRQSVRIQRQIGWPRLETKALKSKRARTALVLPGFIDSLPWQRSGRVLPAATLKDQADEIFRNLLRQAGCYWPGRGYHCLRHTYGRLGMERYRWRIEVLQKFLGHASIRSTEGYAHFGADAAILEAAAQAY